MLGSVQISGEDIGDIEANDICNSLRNDSIRLLSLRGCKVHDKNYRKIMESIKENISLEHLNLNLGMVGTKERTIWLSEGLKGNCMLKTLLLHGNPIGDEGMGILGPSLQRHPSLMSLDMGDCSLGDDAITVICSLIKTSSNKANIEELTLTGNREVTQSGWAQLAMTLAHSTQLKKLFLDYNKIGDFGAGLFSVALSSVKTLELLDLEGTGITDAGAELLCDALESYNINLQELNLDENEIDEEIVKELKECLQENKNSQNMVLQ